MTSSSFTRLFFRILIAAILITAGGTLFWWLSDCTAGPYTASAHGDSSNGVDSRATGYAKGNCGHCHEKHASVGGSEPAPDDGGPSAFLLFTENFDTSKTTGTYLESHNMCFYCHRGIGSSFQQVTNYDYSRTFGGYTGSSIDNILDAFNQQSYHNLYDIWNYYKDVSPTDFFTELSNPCAACHNPHLAKRNNTTPADPTNTSISLPSDHENLYGDDSSERMSQQASAYQAPYKYNSASAYEPVGSVTSDGSEIPDYSIFCTDCHNATNTIYSTTFARDLKFIDWTSDVHGTRMGRDGYSDKGTIKAPYNEASGTDYVLSCLDCHEPHGSNNIYLLRQEVNGVASGVQILGDTDTAAGVWSTFCGTCHNVTVTGPSNPCGSGVHGGYGAPNTPCITCHNHGNRMCSPPFSYTL
jgi:hypothetical protein